MDIQLVGGVDKVMDSENIAIVVMMVIIVSQWALISVLLRGLLKVKDVLHSLTNVITILNERLNHD